MTAIVSTIAGNRGTKRHSAQCPLYDTRGKEEMIWTKSWSSAESDATKFLNGYFPGPGYKFDNTLRSLLPLKHGIYSIADRAGEREGEYLHAGQSRTASKGLYSRVWDQHYCSGDANRPSSDFVQKVMKRQQLARPEAKLWISNNCIVRWVVLDGDAESNLRCWAEHYMLSILRPKWGT
jgi:hypothetical protein